MNPSIVVMCLAIGAITELISHRLKLWTYNPPWLRIANVLIAFGLMFGWVASALAEKSMPLQFLVGAAVGVAYEAANLLFLHFWSFRDDRLLFFRGRLALILGAGIPWGFLPVLAPVLARLV